MAETIGRSTTPPFPPPSLAQHALSDPPAHSLADPSLLPPVDPSIDVHNGSENSPSQSYVPIQHHGHFDMLPPPESTHPSFAALHAFAQSHAAAHGYALSINTTAKNRARVKLACVCYGAPKNTHHLTDETRVRKKRQSSKTGCRMWVEGKKLNDGSWVLKIGEPAHNHEGRHVEEWAVHRRRTWGLGGGGGGIVAGAVPAGQMVIDQLGDVGETVWRIVEEEMEKGSDMVGNGIDPASPDDGNRDRGVGRTVRILQEKLPGIRIFKRDVYNIRAQIKKARKQTDYPERVGPPEEEEEEEIAEAENSEPFGTSMSHHDDGGAEPQYPDIDPALVAQYNATHRDPTPQAPTSAEQPVQEHAAPPAPMVEMSSLAHFSQDETPADEVLQLRSEVERLLAETQRIQAESATEIQRLTAAVARLEAEKHESAIEAQKMKIENEQLKLQVLFSSTRRTSSS